MGVCVCIYVCLYVSLCIAKKSNPWKTFHQATFKTVYGFVLLIFCLEEGFLWTDSEHWVCLDLPSDWHCRFMALPFHFFEYSNFSFAFLLSFSPLLVNCISILLKNFPVYVVVNLITPVVVIIILKVTICLFFSYYLICFTTICSCSGYWLPFVCTARDRA